MTTHNYWTAGAEIERLRAEIIEARRCETMAYQDCAMLETKLAAAERDAARYRRMLEGPYPFCFEGIMCHSAEDVSRAIDAALERKP